MLAACSLGGAGHLQPLVPFLDAAKHSGSETLVVAPPALGEMVRVTGHSFAAGGEPPESLVAPIREQLPVMSPAEASRLGNRELFGALATDAMLAPMRETIASWQPDVILRDPCEYASAVVASESAIPFAHVAIGLAEVEWGSMDVAAPALEARRRGLVQSLRASTYLTRFPATLDPSRFPRTRRYDGWIPSEPQSTLPEWWTRSDVPLVYLTFGTVLGHMSIAGELYEAALRAVAELDANVLLTVGRLFDPESLGPMPPNVHVEPWVDQHIVLSHADIVVCHGGSGTTYGALRAGVPVVVVPLFADQHMNARKVVESKTGVVLDSRGNRPLDPSSLVSAVKSVLTDGSYRARAQRVSNEMASEPSCAERLGELISASSASSP